MLIPALSRDPVVCAQCVPDPHVCKLAAELFQIASTVLADSMSAHGLVRPTHTAHPFTRWAAASPRNLAWLLHLGAALCDEKLRRWPNNPPHVYAPRFASLIAALAPCAPSLSAAELPPLEPSADTVPDSRVRGLVIETSRSGRRARAFKLYYHLVKRANPRVWRFRHTPLPQKWVKFVLTADEQRALNVATS